ncbi:hypothetical protein FGG08_002954 [Glutinoglossum americanum]|uniref:Methyltransferase n=1 Tax=Glutinoglossum americanum TaxID=1670608 RepID=A0A9P8KYM5_9PEZI|nr:hypothetical protein FGG08_002954 [Glutinoglossum americanum]
MDIFHKIFLVARNDALHRAPIIPNYQMRILDLGTGTGIWAIDMSEIPRNLRFQLSDFESEWTLGKESFDLIHLRQGCGSVSSWPMLYRRIFEYVKLESLVYHIGIEIPSGALRGLMEAKMWSTGTLNLEHVEIDFQPRSDDVALPPDLNLVKWYNWLVDATQRAGKSIAYQHTTRQLLQAAGFVDIAETIIRAPYNPWPSDPHHKDIGRWYNLGMTEGLEALSLGPLTRVYHWSPDVVRGLIPGVAKDICSKRLRAYNNMFVPAFPPQLCTLTYFA